MEGRLAEIPIAGFKGNPKHYACPPLHFLQQDDKLMTQEKPSHHCFQMDQDLTKKMGRERGASKLIIARPQLQSDSSLFSVSKKEPKELLDLTTSNQWEGGKRMKWEVIKDCL